MRVVIAGGGFGGIKSALELANKFGMEVTLLSPHSEFEYHSALYRSALGTSPFEIVVRLDEIFKHAKNITVVRDSISQLDAAQKVAIGSSGKAYQYDSLILALGKENNFSVEGAADYTASMYTIPATIDLRSRIVALCRSTIERPRVVIIGAGPTGVELAGDLQMFADMVAHKYGTKRKELRIDIVESAERILPQLHKSASKKATKRLRDLGVTPHINVKAVRCDVGSVLLETGEITCDLTVWTGGSKIVDFYSKYPEVFQIANGRIVVDEFLHASGSQSMYVIGDNAYTKYSGMAQTALNDARFVTHNFLYQQAGVPQATYHGFYPIYALPIGPNWAVIQTQKKVIIGYFAWLIRRRADRILFNNFEPYKKAIKQWRRGNFEANF